MTIDALIAAVGIYAGTFAVGVVSSVLPIVSIEVFLVALVLARGPVDAPLLIALATCGQVLGKLSIYFAARGLTALPGRHRTWIERMRTWLARTGHRPHVVLAASAVLGLPPFSIISTAAGALAISARSFCVVIATGRALRFAVLIALASYASVASS
jgi:membrane protein YqaA with SNARE-associated domain